MPPEKPNHFPYSPALFCARADAPSRPLLVDRPKWTTLGLILHHANSVPCGNRRTITRSLMLPSARTNLFASAAVGVKFWPRTKSSHLSPTRRAGSPPTTSVFSRRSRASHPGQGPATSSNLQDLRCRHGGSTCLHTSDTSSAPAAPWCSTPGRSPHTPAPKWLRSTAYRCSLRTSPPAKGDLLLQRHRSSSPSPPQRLYCPRVPPAY